MPIPILMEDVLELVLVQLSLTELLLSHSLVCRTWRDIIQRRTLLSHRESYFLGRATIPGVPRPLPPTLCLAHDPTDQFTSHCVSQLPPATLTAEQRKIVLIDLSRMLDSQDTIRIIAYASTGKTTTLVEMCR